MLTLMMDSSWVTKWQKSIGISFTLAASVTGTVRMVVGADSKMCVVNQVLMTGLVCWPGVDDRWHVLTRCWWQVLCCWQVLLNGSVCRQHWVWYGPVVDCVLTSCSWQVLCVDQVLMADVVLTSCWWQVLCCWLVLLEWRCVQTAQSVIWTRSWLCVD